MRGSNLERLRACLVGASVVLATDACRSREPAADAARVSEWPPTARGLPSSAPPPPPPTTTYVTPATELPRVEAPPARVLDELPLLRVFIDKVSDWDATLGAQLAQVPLDGTGTANSERALAYLEYRLLVDLLAPALRPSRDRTIIELRQSVEQLVLFEVPLPVENLKMGPADPAACGDCRWTGDTCSQRCITERRLLEPANLAAGGLESNLDFGGHPRAGEDGLVYEGGAPLGVFLDAVVSVGVARAEVIASLKQLFVAWVARCRYFHEVASGEPPTAAAAMVDGINMWRATYARSLPEFSQLVPGIVAAEPLESSWSRFEVSTLRQVSALRVYAAKVERVSQRNEWLERRLRDGTIKEFEYVARPDLDCEAQPTRTQGVCFETTLGLEALRDRVFDLSASGPVANEAPLMVAEALEHLTMAGLDASAVMGGLLRLCKDAGLVFETVPEGRASAASKCWTASGTRPLRIEVVATTVLNQEVGRRGLGEIADAMDGAGCHSSYGSSTSVELDTLRRVLDVDSD